MKKLWALLAIVLAFTLPLEAHAKRFGGGKSFGRSYQTAPAQPARADALPGAAGKPAPAAAQAGARKGMLGGLLGGLLAGGLLAALFAGGAFEGLQLMDVLLVGGALMLIVFLWRSRQASQAARPQPAYARTAPAGEPIRPHDGVMAASGGAQVPFNLPLGFDGDAFLAESTTHYRTLQDAWNRNDLERIRTYVVPELFTELAAERASLTTAPQTEILSVRPELVRADQQFGTAVLSIRFSGRYRDRGEGVEEDFVDVWHLQRDSRAEQAQWHLVGIESR